MTVLAPFSDVERAVADLASDLGTVGTETNITLQSALPYIRPRRRGGSDDRITDVSRLDVDVFDVDATSAKEISEVLRQRLISGPNATAHGIIDRAQTEVGPQIVPTDDTTDIRRVVTSYRVSMRR